MDKLIHTLSEIEQIVRDTPNDMELGGKIRQLFVETKMNSEDIEKLKQVLSEQIVEEDSIRVKKYIYESPDGGKTVYRREFGGDVTSREKVDWETEKEKMRTNFYDPFSDDEINANS